MSEELLNNIENFTNILSEFFDGKLGIVVISLILVLIIVIFRWKIYNFISNLIKKFTKEKNKIQ